MKGSLSIFAVLSALSVGFAGAGCLLPLRLKPAELRREEFLRSLPWLIKGLVLPMALWAVMNLGISFSLQPFMPQVQAAQNSGLPWSPVYLQILSYGTFVVSSYWAAATLAWAILETHSQLKGGSLKNFQALCLTSGVGMLIVAVVIYLLGGWPAAGAALLVMLAPIAGYAPGLVVPRKMPPMYSRAIAKMKFGKYDEAEWEIIRQLEQHQNDFNGWLMMAALYAEHFRDLTEAEQTILEICDQPGVTPPQVSIALHRLADWHLKHGEDPEAARRDLQMIEDRLPGSHLALMARLRKEQLPASREELQDQQAHKRISLPALGDSLDDGPPEPASKPERAHAMEMANACVAKLKAFPNNVSSRDELAHLMLDYLGQPEQAIEQLQMLLQLPNQSDSNRADWLSRIAAAHLKYRQDREAGRAALEQLIEAYPSSVQAFTARRRLAKLNEPAPRPAPRIKVEG